MKMHLRKLSLLGMTGVMMVKSPTCSSHDSLPPLALSFLVEDPLTTTIILHVNSTRNWLDSSAGLITTLLLPYMKNFLIFCVLQLKSSTTSLAGGLDSINCIRLDIPLTMRIPFDSLSTIYRWDLHTISFDNKFFMTWV